MNYRGWFYGLNFALLLSFAYAYWIDFTPEWKKYQKQYYRMAASALDKKAAAAKPEEAKALGDEAARLRRAPSEIKQIIAKDLNRVDRCITCHMGMDEYVNPTMTNDFKEHPYKAHPKIDSLAKNHPFQKYGCTVCHQGQGLATTAEAAHGKVHSWEKPLLEGSRVQASCVTCHANFEKLPGAEIAAKGKALFDRQGCRGCHSIRGVGGVVSVDLGDIADKPLERIAGYNFQRIKKNGVPLSRGKHEWTLQNWILGHLTNDPIEVVPNDPFAKYNTEPVAPSGMQDFREELGQEGAEAITTFLMGLTAEQFPHRYYVAAAPAPEPSFSDPLKHGQFVFEKYGCAGCHGIHGAKGRRNFNALGPDQSDPEKDMGKGREPTLVDTVGTYTKDELIKKIASGVPGSAINKFNPNGPTPPLYMPAWKDKIKSKDMDDLAAWLLSIAKKDESGF